MHFVLKQTSGLIEKKVSEKQTKWNQFHEIVLFFHLFPDVQIQQHLEVALSKQRNQ